MARRGESGEPQGPRQGAWQRLDLWLFQARFFRSRALAVAMLAGGVARLNGQRVVKPGTAVGPGDVLTFPQGGRIRVVRLRALAVRRGPAAEAQALYDDLAPLPPRDGPATLERWERAG